MACFTYNIFLQLPPGLEGESETNNCGFDSILSQIKDVPAGYKAVHLRYQMVAYFCEHVKFLEVSTLNNNKLQYISLKYSNTVILQILKCDLIRSISLKTVHLPFAAPGEA